MADMGQNVGKINIKVLPDTSKFKETLNKRISVIEKTAKKVRIEARLDDKVLKAQVRRTIRDVNKDLRDKDHLKIKFRSKFEDGDAIRQINTTAKNLQKYAREGVKINPKIDREKWREAKNWLERWYRGVSPLDVEVRPSMLTGAASYVNARLTALTRPRTVQIAPVVNGVAYKKALAMIAALSGGRTLHNFGKDFLNFIGGLDKAIPKIAAFSTVLINLSSYLMVATSNTLSFAASFATMFQSLLAAPGILGGLAVGLGATFAVLKDFNKVLPQVADKFHDLQDSMSTKFWARAKKPFEDFINDIFPHFQRGLEKNSVKIGNFFRNLLDSAKGAFDGELDDMMQNLGFSIDVAAQHAQSFVGILSKLGQFGARQLPQLAGWVGKIADEFDRWLLRNEANGNLQAWLDEGIAALKDFGGLLAATGSMFSGLARAAQAAGGSTLQMMRDTMEGVADTVNSPRFQKALTNAFRGAHLAMNEISRNSGPEFRSFILRLTNIFRHSLPVAGRIAGKALGGIFNAFDTDNVESTILGVLRSLERAVDALVPAMGPLVEAFAGIARAAAEVAESIARNVAPVIEKLGPKVASLADDLNPLINALGSGLGAALNIVATTLGAIPNILLIVAAGFTAMMVAQRTATVGTTALSGATTRLSLGIFHMWPLLRQIPTYLFRWGQAASQASASTLAARRAVGPLAGAVGKGVAQMGALAVVASGAADKMGLTNTITLGLAGSMIGPWGTAAGLAIGSFVDLKSAIGGFNKPFAELSKQLEENSAAFDVNGKAVDAAIKKADKMAAAHEKQLNKGFLSTTKHLLTSKQGWHDYAAALTGGKTASEKAADAAVKHATTLMRQEDAALALGEALGVKLYSPLSNLKDISQSAAPAMEALGYTFDSLSKMNLDQQANAFERIRDWMAHADSDAGRIEVLGQSIQGIGTDMLTAKDAADQFKNALLGLVNPQLEMEASTDQWRQTMRNLSDQLVRGAGFTGVAGEQNRALTRTFMDQTIAMLASTAAATRDKQVIAQRITETINGLYREGEAAKMSREAIAARIQTMGLTPELVKTIFENAGIKVSQDEIANLLKGIKTVDTTKASPKVTGPTQKEMSSAGKAAQTGVSNILKTIGGKLRDGFGNLKLGTLSKSVTSAAKAAGAAGGAEAGSAGGQVSAGMAGGISGGRSGVINAAISVARSAIAAARAELDIHSPSRVFKKIGAFLTAGFAQGIVGGTSEVTSKMDRLIDLLRKTSRKRLIRMAEETRKELLKMAKQWEKLTARIQEIQQYVDNVKNNIAQAGSPVEVNGGTFADIIGNLKGSVKDAREFAKVLEKLRNLGLNKTTMDQLAQAGPEAALAAAQSIAAAGQAGVNQVNTLQNQLSAAANTAANAAADVMFSNGKNIVKGLLEGLKAKKKDLEKAMENMANALVRVIRRKLGIKSPSRVFRTLGDHIGSGFVQGIEGQHRNAKSAILGLAEARPSSALDYAVSRGLRTQSINNNKTINYYAAAGNSLSAQEELFEALARARSL